MFIEKDYEGRKILYLAMTTGYYRKIAVIEREKDVIVALGYDTTDGTWQQGIYRYKSLREALLYINEKHRVIETMKSED